MKVVTPDQKTWEDKLGYSKKIFLNEDFLKIPGARFQQIKIKPGETAPTHYHKIQTEIFYFLTENGYWTINGQKFTPKIGDILVIEPYDKHEVTNNTNEDYLYLSFKYNYLEEDFYED